METGRFRTIADDLFAFSMWLMLEVFGRSWTGRTALYIYIFKKEVNEGWIAGYFTAKFVLCLTVPLLVWNTRKICFYFTMG